MNPYTIEPSKSEYSTASAPTAVPAPVYASSAVQYPKLESTATTTATMPTHIPPMYQYSNTDPAMASAPMMVPMYMPSNYQYPRHESTAIAAPAPMVAPVYVPSTQYQHIRQNPPVTNVQGDVNKIRDWLPWSIISIFLGGLFPGFLPLIFSLLCRSKKRKNDVSGARTMSTLALVFNIIMTILGVLSIVGLVVYLIIFSQRVQNQEF
ncbi:hypothetical protein I4U23_020338 [Adineta vaga]|nr:hypothetical protein I4U23_020338 [Adineta vaga]